MTRKQEIDAIYDRLCWALKGAAGCDVDPDIMSDIIILEELARFIQTVDSYWGLQEADSSLMSSSNIDKWDDLEGVAKHIYEGGGRINQPMKKKKSE